MARGDRPGRTIDHAAVGGDHTADDRAPAAKPIIAPPAIHAFAVVSLLAHAGIAAARMDGHGASHCHLLHGRWGRVSFACDSVHTRSSSWRDRITPARGVGVVFRGCDLNVAAMAVAASTDRATARRRKNLPIPQRPTRHAVSSPVCGFCGTVLKRQRAWQRPRYNAGMDELIAVFGGSLARAGWNGQSLVRYSLPRSWSVRCVVGSRSTARSAARDSHAAVALNRIALLEHYWRFQQQSLRTPSDRQRRLTVVAVGKSGGVWVWVTLPPAAHSAPCREVTMNPARRIASAL